MTWGWWGDLTVLWFKILILNWFNFNKRQNASKTTAKYLIHILVSHCHIPHLFSPFPWLKYFWMLLGLFITGTPNLLVHRTPCMPSLGIREISIYLMHKVFMESKWAESQAFPVCQLEKSFQLQKAAHFKFLLLSWLSWLIVLSIMVIYSFQLSLFANIWTPINYHCWHKWWQQLRSLNLILYGLVNPVKFYYWSLHFGKKYKIQYYCNCQHWLI